MGFPGAGSLLAGRGVGYGQAVAALAAMGLTFVFGIMFILWFYQNREALRAPDADPFETLRALWLHLRWAFVGLIIYGCAWIWALITSLDIMQRSRRG